MLDAESAANFFHDLAEQPLGIVFVAEEAAIERRKPRAALKVSETCEGGDAPVKPTSRSQNGEKGVVAVEHQVCREKSRQYNRYRQKNPARESVLQPSADNHADVEEPMAQDRVGEGEGENQESRAENQV